MESHQVSESKAWSAFRGRGVQGIVAAAVLLAAGALNIGSGQVAEARGNGVWDRLAGCESGGNWRIDTGNGFSGGLQLAHSTWHSFGGGAYAPRAARATRSQQIKVAGRVVARQGWGAWPACAASLGLNSDSWRGGSRMVTERSVRPRHAGATARSWERHKHAYAKHHKAGLHRNTNGSLTVNSGDTVSGIAYARGCDWLELYQLNRKAIGVNPDLIYPKMQLAVPPTVRR